MCQPPVKAVSNADFCTTKKQKEAEAASFCTLYARSEADADQAERAIRAALVFSPTPVPPAPLCYAVITKDGVKKY